MAENAKWLDSIEGKTYQFTNALQTMWSNILDSEMIKGFIDFGTDAIQFLDTTEGKIVALVTAVRLLTKSKGISIGGIFQGLSQSLQQINAATSALNALKTADTVNGVFNPSSIQAYAATVSQLTPKLQAQALATNGLSNAQIQQALSLNGVDQANIKVAMSQLSVMRSTQQSTAVTAADAAAILAAQGVKLSDAATSFLQEHATEEVTEAMLNNAVAAGTLTTAEATQIAVSLGLTGANHGLAASFKAIGTSIKFMISSNPIGFIITIATTLLSLLPIFDMIGDSAEESMEDVENSFRQAIDECKQIAKDFKSLKQSADDIIPRFAELSEGVDRFGNNISLTDDEYTEFIDLNNQIAEMFPQLNMGFDENGNAMLALAGTADTLAQSLRDLVEAERIAANQKIADEIPGVLSDIEKIKSAKSEETQEIQHQIDLLYGEGKDRVWSPNGTHWDEASSDFEENVLKKYGIEYTKKYQRALLTREIIGIEYDWDASSQEVQNAIAGYEKQIDNLLVETKSKYQSLNSMMAAWMSTEFDYQKLDSDLQYIATTMVNSLDFQKLASEKGIDTEDEIHQYIRNNILNPIVNAEPEIQEAYKELFSIDPSNMSTLEYTRVIKSKVKEIADASDGLFTYDQLLEQTGYKDILKQYANTTTNIMDILYPKPDQNDFNNSRDWAKSLDEYYDGYNSMVNKIQTLSPAELTKAFNLIKEYGLNTWDEVIEALNKKTFDFVLDYDVETEGIDKVRSALEESITATGLSAESIANLKQRYQDLDSYDPAKLFEETTHGIHLNSEALRELEREYENQNKNDLDEKLEGLVEHYNDLTLEIENCADASERANLYAQRQNVLKQINDTATLAAQYEGLTSAYNKWKTAQSDGDERDMYESVLSGREEIDEELTRGWVDEGTRAYLELLSGKDLSTASYDEILKVYKELNKEINDAGYNVYDFFTQDDDGNSTTEGIFNFFDSVIAAQDEVGKNWIKVNKETGEYSFDFGIDGDKEIAEALGISEELVQIILRAAQDAGFDINMDSSYSKLADFEDEVEVVNNRLKELGATEYTFNINSTDVKQVEKQITEAETALKNLKNEDGTLKVNVSEKDYENAQTLLATLIYQKQSLDDSIVLSIDTSSINEGDVQKEIQALLDYKKAYNEFEVKTAIGMDTTEAKEKLEEAKAKLSELPKEHLTTLNIDLAKTPEQINAAIGNITKDALLTIGVNDDAIKDYENGEYNTTGTVTWENNTKAVTDWMAETLEASGEVNWENNVDKVKTHFTATGTIDWSGGGTSINGTAHAGGTAHANGSWGAKQTETALVGELGPELLVRNGRWTTIGDNGAEFTQIKKGDIIFNHKQTEDLLSKGYVTGRGKLHGGSSAFASGTAYSGGGGPGRDDVTQDAVSGGAAERLEEAGNSVSSAADKFYDSADKFSEVFDFIAVRIEEINEDIELSTAKLENAVGAKASNAIIEDLISQNERLYKNLKAAIPTYGRYANTLKDKIDPKWHSLADDGGTVLYPFRDKLGEEQYNAIQEYRDWIQKVADMEQQAEEALTEISSLAKQAIDNIAAEFENKLSLRENKSDQLEAYNALLETTYGTESESIYKALIKINKDNIAELSKQRDAMQQELNKQVETGNIKKYSQDWYDAINDIAALDTEIIELTADNNDLQDSINEIHWYYSDLLMSQFEAVSEEAENLIDILTTKDVVDEMGNWTDEGITALGLYAQQMEVAEKQAKEYAEEITYLNKNWKKLGYTEEEYIDKLDELKSGQYDSIQAYYDAKDAIVDLNEERIDAIKDGIEKEIEAREELIEKQKEELDAEKDLYNFQKSIMEQEKDVAAIQRQLAALSADNSASARAKRAQLEAELAEAQAALEESYYDRSVSNRQDALDKELENFKTEKDEEIEGLENYLENTEQVVSDSLATVQSNTDIVLQTLRKMGNEYSLDITDSLINPWKSGSDAISDYKDTFGKSISETMELLDELIDKFDAASGSLHNTIENSGNNYISDVNDNISGYTGTNKNQTSTSGGQNGDGATSTAGMVSSLSGYIRYGNTGSRVKKLQQALNELGFNCGKVDGIFGVKTLAAVKNFQQSSKYGGAISADGIVGPITKKKFKTAKYAKGTKNVSEDQLALIDELGEELILRAHNGRLTFLEKGSSVVPADLTSNLMEWGKLDPSIMLDQNRPKIVPSKSIINTEVSIDCSVGTMVNIEHCDQNALPDVEKIVNKAFDKHMQTLNNSIKRYTR